MKSNVAHSTLLCGLIGLSNAKVYLAGDSTMASNGANDGVTDGMLTHQLLHLPPVSIFPKLTRSFQAGAPIWPPTSLHLQK